MDPLLLRVAVVALVVLLSALAGRVWQRRDGRVALAATRSGRDHRAGLGLATDHDGPQAVLFGSPTCAPCDTVKSLLRDVAASHDRFRWHYVDAADQLALADEHDVRRVPTLLVVDERGEIVARSSGVPHRDELAAALRTRAPA
jgi:thioredoxin 1